VVKAPKWLALSVDGKEVAIARRTGGPSAMKNAKNPRASMSLSVVTVVAAIATAAAGCGGSTTNGMNLGTIDSAAELADLMDAAALPMARVFTLINGGTASVDEAARSSLAALTSPVSCPSGGSASYSTTGTPQVTFTNCDLGGVAFSGVLYVTLSSVTNNYTAIISGGNLTMSGGATGTLSILNGMIQWSTPVTDANTYWQISVTINGAAICAWSGGGTCL
jgi:hypothetical protein